MYTIRFRCLWVIIIILYTYRYYNVWTLNIVNVCVGKHLKGWDHHNWKCVNSCGIQFEYCYLCIVIYFVTDRSLPRNIGEHDAFVCGNEPTEPVAAEMRKRARNVHPRATKTRRRRIPYTMDVILYFAAMLQRPCHFLSRYTPQLQVVYIYTRRCDVIRIRNERRPIFINTQGTVSWPSAYYYRFLILLSSPHDNNNYWCINRFAYMFVYKLRKTRVV